MNYYLYFNLVMGIINKQNNMNYKKFALHCASWSLLYLFIIFILVAVDSHPINWSLILAICLVVTAAIPIYLHFYFFNKYFNNNHYILYSIAVVTIVCLSALSAFYFYSKVYDSTMYLIAWCIDVFVVIVLSSALKILWNGLSERVKYQETRTKNLESELQLLKTQMNPHFYFNTLNNLYSLSLEKSDRVPDIIVQLSDIMRYVLDSSKKNKVALEEEITYLKNYLSLEKLRSEEDNAIKFETHGTWEGKDIIPMILIPFAENCIKHGDINSKKGWLINISLIVRDNKLIFSTRNRKKSSLDMYNSSKSTGLGIKNVKRRLELLYPNKHQLDISQDETNFRITLEIDL